MDNEKKSVWTGNGVLVVAAMVMGVMMGAMFTSHKRSDTASSLQEKVGEVAELVADEYVDVMDADSMAERLVGVMLAELDPHSAYLSVLETERTEELMRGRFEGVGLLLRREGDTTFVGNVIADGPSADIGLRAGDKIVRVDGRKVTGLPADTVVALLRGPRRTTVAIDIERFTPRGTTESIQYKVRRGVVNHHTVLYYGMLDDTTGYVFLSTFSSTSHDEFHTALRDLTSKGMRHLIFDLRGNTGGSLSAAVDIAGELLPTGSLIVYTEGAHSPRQNIYARRGGLFTTGRVTVMVDESSASASEVVSGALQDNDRATIVGRRTFGKGLVQREFALSDGSSVLLTTARYYTPSGRSIQRPYDRGTDEYYREYLDQLVQESYADSMTLHITDSTEYHTVGGRIVYGGGGIFPDLPIAYRKDPSYGYYNRLAGSGALQHVAFDEVRHHGAALLQRYADADAFYRHYRVDERLLRAVRQWGEQHEVPSDAAAFNTQRILIATLVKAYIASHLYGNEAFHRIYLDVDEDLKVVREKNTTKN